MKPSDYPGRNDILKVFGFGSFLGMVVFVILYGTKIIDCCYDAWLLNPSDLVQHYLGWCLYRNSPWTFPIGLTPEYAWPLEISVIYADVIPICAVFFKLLSPWLPEVFQYFGLWGIFCYALQGGLAAILLRRFIASNWWSGIFSLFFIFGSQMMVRMYIHTALGSQWILLLALCFLFYGEIISSKLGWKLLWSLMGCLCVWVHGYFVPMVFLVMLTWLYMYWYCHGHYKACIHVVGCYLLGVAASMWGLGAFSLSFASAATEVGVYGANLDTFFNPIIPVVSRFMPCYGIPVGQYEGWSYLGLGGLLLLSIAIFKSSVDFFRGERIDNFYFPVLMLWLACAFLAVMPKVCIHDTVLFDIGYPYTIEYIMSIFRVTGRFIWIPAYLLLLFSIVKVAGTGRHAGSILSISGRRSSRVHSILTGHRLGASIVLLMLLIQLADFSSGIRFLHRSINDGFLQYYHVMQLGEEHHLTGEGRAILKGYEAVGEIMSQYRYVAYTDYHFVNNSVDNAVKGMMIAYYAHNNDAKLEAFYLARMPDKHLEAEQEKLLGELKAGKPRADTLYVIADRAAAKEYKGLVYREINGLLLGSMKPLE